MGLAVGIGRLSMLFGDVPATFWDFEADFEAPSSTLKGNKRPTNSHSLLAASVILPAFIYSKPLSVQLQQLLNLVSNIKQI
jgi:hypothetical protein